MPVGEELFECGVSAEAGELLLLLEGVFVMDAFDEGLAQVFDGFGLHAGLGKDSGEAEVHFGHLLA